MGQNQVSHIRRCPLFGGFFYGGFTVLQLCGGYIYSCIMLVQMCMRLECILLT